MKITTINPTTEEILQEYTVLNQKQVDQTITAAHQCFKTWKTTDITDRSHLMLKMASALRAKQSEFAALMANEMGKPIASGEAEIEKCAWVCEYFATHAAQYLQPHLVPTKMRKSMICYQPLGVIFAIMPWNFPFWQVFRFAAPNIMGGNVALLKHAPNTTGSGHAIRDLFLEVGFPEHVFQHLVIDNEMAAHVIAHEHVRGVTLTGSERAGRIVAANAASHLKKVVLELGGCDPYIVLKDADLNLAARSIVASRLNNSGQTCIAAKRAIVVKDVAEELLSKVRSCLHDYTLGDPLDKRHNMGPMAREDLRANLHQQVLDSVAQGATLNLGGQLPKTRGFFYPPTILTQVKPGMPAFDDELFGPVFAFIEANDEAEAIQLANHSRFGLSAAIFTRDIEHGEYLATYAIDVGTCFVNSMVSSQPDLPFGGIKNSGFGRELAREGLLEFMNIKTVGIHE